MYCHNCGSQIPDVAKFCNVCGASCISKSKSPKRENEIKQKRKQLRRRKRTALSILIICLFLFVLIGAVLYLLPPLKHLYVYSSSEINANTFTQASINYDTSYFRYTCLTYLQDDYFIFYPETGNGWNYSELQKELWSAGYVSVREIGDTAYLEMQYDTGGSFTIVYHKASLTERIYIIKQFLSWEK